MSSTTSASNPNRRSTVLDDPAFQGGMPHITDVTDTLLSSPNDFADYELLTGTTSPTATQLQKAAKMKEMKRNDPAVLYNVCCYSTSFEYYDYTPEYFSKSQTPLAFSHTVSSGCQCH